MLRSRPPVGRRLWRRRRRRSDDPTTAATGRAGGEGASDDDHDADDHDADDHDADDHDADDHDADDHDADDHDAEAVTALAPDGREAGARGLHGQRAASTTSSPAQPGLVGRLVGRLVKRFFAGGAPSAPGADADAAFADPTREILALPRGVARLDAFEKALASLAAAAAGRPHQHHRRVALAFHKELTGLADDAGVDLQLYETRVSACAHALIAAGEDENAGALLARLGRRHQAAESFVRAGAIDALEEQHAAHAFDEGGARLDARLSFERFEALLLVGLRDDALAALERACALWDNPVYAEVLAGFRARIPDAGVLQLVCGDDVAVVVAHLPVVIGRGEECGVRLDSPLVSRAHVELAATGQGLVVRALAAGGSSTTVDGQPLSTDAPLLDRGHLQLAGVTLDYEQDEHRLLLRPRLRPRHVTLVARRDALDDPAIGARLLLRGGRFRLDVDPRARLEGEPLRRAALLLVGDRITVGGRTWTVARG